MDKYQKLLKIILRKKYIFWDQIKEYIEQFKKYDNWTLRDIDKVYNLIHSKK